MLDKKNAVILAFIGASAAYLLYKSRQNLGVSNDNQANQGDIVVSDNIDPAPLIDTSTLFSGPFSFASYAPALTEYITGESDMTPEGQRNLTAFLKTIRKWESSVDDSAYTVLYGGGHFSSFADHPRVKVPIKNDPQGRYSTAAGAYQILAGTWDGVKNKIGATDFSPANQDAAAIELIKERGAYNLILAGNFTAAVNAIRKEWASVPGSPYGQGGATLPQYTLAYQSFGGTVNV